MTKLRELGGVWGPLAFGGAAVLSARRVAGYSHRRNHISGLAAQEMPSAPIMVPGFLILGVGGLVQPIDDPLVERLVRIAGAATVVAGVARCSSVECPVPWVDDDATASDALHTVASVVGFSIWTTLPVVTARRSGPEWYRRSSCILAMASALGCLASAGSAQSGSAWRGLAQRLFLVPVFAWHTLTSVRTIAT